MGYIKSAVAGLDLPNISGQKDWGAYEITGLSVKQIFIEAENVKVEVGEHFVIKAQNVQSIFDEFSWSFKKETFPKMVRGGIIIGHARIKYVGESQSCMVSGMERA